MSLFVSERPFLLVTRIAYLGLRDVDPPEQAVLESLGIASYYTQVIMLLNQCHRFVNVFIV